MISFALITAVIGMAIAILISVVIGGSIDKAVTCPIQAPDPIIKSCNDMKKLVYMPIYLLPVVVFIVVFISTHSDSSHDTKQTDLVHDLEHENLKRDLSRSSAHAYLTHGNFTKSDSVKSKLPKIKKFEVPETDFDNI